jgi:hypothetical protein
VTGAPQQALAVVLAVAGASCYAVASVTQQQSAAKLQSSSIVDPVVLLRLARARRWQLGLIAVICGFGLQAAALDLGRLVVVEPVFPVGLLFALLLAAKVERRRLRHSEWIAAVATVAGMAVFLLAAMPTGGNHTAAAGPLGISAALAAGVAGLCCLIAFRVAPAHRALALAVGGGFGAGVTDALTKTVAGLVGTYHLALFADIRVYLLAGVGLMTFTMQQNGFRAAGLPASLPAFAVLEPVVGSILGLLIYHEGVGDGPGNIAAEALGVGIAIWGIAMLAKSVMVATAQRAAPEPPPPAEAATAAAGSPADPVA